MDDPKTIQIKGAYFDLTSRLGPKLSLDDTGSPSSAAVTLVIEQLSNF